MELGEPVPNAFVGEGGAYGTRRLAQQHRAHEFGYRPVRSHPFFLCLLAPIACCYVSAHFTLFRVVPRDWSSEACRLPRLFRVRGWWANLGPPTSTFIHPTS